MRENATLGDLIIAILGSAGSSRRLYSLLEEDQFATYKPASIKVTLSRLNKNGYLKNSNSSWSITNKGQRHLKKTNLKSYITSPFKGNEKQNTIISFDIPEKDRVLRDWLRNQLKIFGYKMLQQSLWIGAGPLPQKFLKRLIALGIRKNVKIFRIKT